MRSCKHQSINIFTVSNLPKLETNLLYYCPQTKLRKGNVFTPVCQSFCSRGGMSASVHAGIHPPGQTFPPGRPPPPQQTATAAGGMHPTGMLSCYLLSPRPLNI